MLLRGKNIFSPYRVERLPDIYSPLLKRMVVVDVFIPPSYYSSRRKYPILVINDGQDSEAVRIKSTLTRLTRSNEIREVLVIAIHAGDRMQEYGVAAQSDYRKRGNKADLYTGFLLEELLPLIKASYRVDIFHDDNAIAGYSLGGLSAFDIGWNHPEIFKKIGVFSGSFWWRSKSYSGGYLDDRDRIAHAQVMDDEFKPGLRFWFEAGTQDERADRNNNGVIDAIDDTIDMIVELTKKGYRPFKDIEYVEIKGGHHNQKTWAKAMPQFLKWAYGIKELL
ncbi:MAG: alpha/beta hydrolase-fold protein [Chitinophagales bacterium]